MYWEEYPGVAILLARSSIGVRAPTLDAASDYTQVRAPTPDANPMLHQAGAHSFGKRGKRGFPWLGRPRGSP